MTLRVFAAAGVMLGLVWGLHNQPRVICHAHSAAAAAINHCTSASLTAIALHWAIALGGGFLVGGAVGLGCVLAGRALRADS
jgi:hypothetical protein